MGRNRQGRAGVDHARWIIRLLVGVSVLGFVGWLQFRTPPERQRLVVINEYADARCRFSVADGTWLNLSVRKGRTFRKTYDAPTSGFALLRCNAGGRLLQSPGHFHLQSDGLAEVTLSPSGEMEVRYEKRRYR
jgi:hypothetical protein